MIKNMVTNRQRTRHPQSPWTAPRVAHLRRRWAQGATAMQIARELGFDNRNVVLAKVHRMGIGKLSPYGGAPGRRQRSRRALAVAVAPAPGLLHLWRPRATPSWVIAAQPHRDESHADAVIPPAQRCALLDLDASRCRWPVGDPAGADFFFCGGAALAGGPYCAAHAARAYLPALPRPPRRRRRGSKIWWPLLADNLHADEETT